MIHLQTAYNHLLVPWHLTCHLQCGQTAITTFFWAEGGTRPWVSPLTKSCGELLWNVTMTHLSKLHQLPKAGISRAGKRRYFYWLENTLRRSETVFTTSLLKTLLRFKKLVTNTCMFVYIVGISTFMMMCIPWWWDCFLISCDKTLFPVLRNQSRSIPDDGR